MVAGVRGGKGGTPPAPHPAKSYILIEQMESSSISAFCQLPFSSCGDASRELCYTLGSPFPFPRVYSLPSVALMKVLASLRGAHTFQSPSLP